MIKDKNIYRQRCKNRNKMYNYGIQYFYLSFNFKFNIIISLTTWMQADHTDRQRQIGETEEVIKNGQSRETKQKTQHTMC
jgi:hypothetical protein